MSTQGSYILYPGDEDVIFREDEDRPIPSVGAFPLTPGDGGNEEEQLENFILGIVKLTIY